MKTGAWVYFVGVSLLAIAGPVLAQDQSKAANVEEVVVTGSRIVQSGYARPTPVTIVSADLLQKSSPSSLVQGVLELPAFSNSNSPKNSNDVTMRAGNGSKAGTYLNLRGLGSVRNLILEDGIRVPASTAAGQVDVNIIPELLVSRVDVVTAGVSAVYGSDAVSGVVNFILDHNFTGVKGLIQGGQSTYGDGGSWKGGVAFGAGFMGDRGHFLASFEKSGSAAVQKFARKYSNDNWYTARGPGVTGTPGTAAAPLRYFSNVGSNNAAPNGFILNGLPGFTNVTWTNNAQLRAYDPGIAVAANSQQGGDASFFPQHANMISNPYRDQGFVRASYDVTDKINVFAQLSATRTTTDYDTNFASVRFGIQADNPFLPPEAKAALAARLAALPAGATAANPNPLATTSCGFGTPVIGCYVLRIPYGIGTDFAQEVVHEQQNALNYKIGATGEILPGWNFDIAYTHGKVKWYSQAQGELQQARITAAGDSVINPATGQPICRVLLVNPSNPNAQGCIPYNFNGLVQSKALWDYLGGTSPDGLSWFQVENTTQDWVGNLTGSPFSTWAGPVGIAVGAEYRKSKLNQFSNSNPAIPPDCSGIRNCNTGAGKFLSTNTGFAKGEITVKEANIEAEVPLAADLPFAKSLIATGAFRYTDYSTSGSAKTWKVGGTWEPVEDIRFRLTRSHDLRAPTLLDLFGGTTNTRGVFVDPHCNCQGFNGAFVITGGNPNLVPETANTLTYGVVFKPSFIPGFTASIDYYSIKMKNVINTLSATQVEQQCEDSGGTAPICADIQRPFPFSDRSINNTAISVKAGPVNAALMNTSGLDFEATYRFPVNIWQLDGDLTLHLIANNVRKFDFKGYSSDTLHRLLGLTGTPPANNPFNIGDQPIPKWQGSLSATYKQGPVTVFVQGRMVDKLKLGPLVFAEADLPRIFYTDVTATYDMKVRGSDVQLFGTVNNLFNQTAPLFPTNLVSGLDYPSLVQLYDVMGRYYTVGARFKF